MRIHHIIATGLFFSFLGYSQTSSSVPDHVPGRLIVVHKGGVADPRAAQLFAQRGATVHNRLTGVGATVIDVAAGTEETVRQSLLRSSLFRAVEYDFRAHVAAVPGQDSGALARARQCCRKSRGRSPVV